MKVSVCVFKPKGRPYHQAQWTDPDTGRKKTRSTGERSKRAALKFAAKLEADIHAGRFRERRRIPWSNFRERFELEVLPAKREKTRWKFDGTFHLLDELIRPGFLQSLDAATISAFATKLRKDDRSEATVKGHLSNIRTMLNWARRQELIDKVPRIDMPTKTAKMGGRPITLEEFERLLDAVPKALHSRHQNGSPIEPNAAVVESWRFLLRGLWWSGLRLAEALDLDWIDDRLLCVDFTGRRPMLRIKAEGQKSGKNTVLPMTPEFAELLQATPEVEREGRVFNPLPVGRNSRAGSRMRVDSSSKVISQIGKAAGVKVAENSRRGKVRIKFATAHDLRRAFGVRWSTRVMPPVLQQLMRHESIDTTMKNYVGRNAETAADALWEAVADQKSNAVANDSANTRPDASSADSVMTSQADEINGFTKHPDQDSNLEPSA